VPGDRDNLVLAIAIQIVHPLDVIQNVTFRIAFPESLAG
jgi:hypothetical protein